MPHAQIDAYFIERFYLLTRNEMIVYCYLRQRFNSKTKRCDPAQKTIAFDTNLPASRISEAVKGLEEKQWVILNSDGNFSFCESVTESVRKVTESVRKKLRISEVKVTNSVKEVTNSVTEIKGIEHTRTDKEQTKEITNVISKKISRKRSRPLTEFPENFEVTEAMKRWAKSKGYDSNLAEETEAFIDNHLSKANKFADWSRAWQTWVRNANTRFKPKGQTVAANSPSKDEFHQKTEAPRIDYATAVDSHFLGKNHKGESVTWESYEEQKTVWLSYRENKGFESEVEIYERKHDVGQRIDTPGQGANPKPDYERWRKNGNGQKSEVSVSR